nr:MAG: ORF1 [TTV-like mini virus]
MPPFYYRRYWKRWRQPYWRRHRRIRRWRIRKTFPRRHRRRNWVRRRHFRYRNRKLKRITVKEWQPKTIRKCIIKGDLCLISCGKGRENHNYTLYSESLVPKGEPGGGGWSIMQLSLRALYDEYLKFRCWWTKSNTGLPLVKYNGITIKLYRSSQTDYLFKYKTCPPFDVTEHDYLNTQPSRMLMDHRTIIVPRLDKQFKRRPYIKKRIYPPSLMQSKWYFQKDLYNCPLIMFTTSTCNLDQMYGPQNQLSYNMTLTSLNLDFFQNPQWKNIPDTGYKPKYTGTYDTYLYTTHNGSEPDAWTKLVPLFETTKYQDGQKITNVNSVTNKSTWGNPFTQYNIDRDVRYYYGPYPIKPGTTNQLVTPFPGVTQLDEVYLEVRYNPMADNGKGNIVYIKPTSTTQGSFLTLPQNENLIIRDFPLWLIFWGWEDWQRKLKDIHHIEHDYQIVIQTKFFEPKRSAYLLLDKYFTQPKKIDLTETDKANWYPKTEMQSEQLNQLALGGPATPKITDTRSIECHLNYKLSLKWGGCPAPMEIINDPSKQEKFPTPNIITEGLKIQDPNTDKESYIYMWDERHQELTKKAAKRIREYSSPTKYFADYGPLDLPAEKETSPETTTEEEKETSPEEQLFQLKLQQRDLKRRIRHLLKKPKLFP